MTKHRITLVLCILLSLAWTVSTQAQGQGAGWSEPYRLSSDAGKASEASLVVDRYGNMHSFWTETLFENHQTIIKYARFDGTTWSKPNDIYVTGREVGTLSASLDRQGVLHVAWGEGLRGPAYHIHAPANNALSAQDWAKPLRISVPATIVSLRVDSRGIYHLVYIDEDEAGVYYIRSGDQGLTWSEPLWLDPNVPTGYKPQDLSFELDDTDGLHAVWNYGAVVNDAAESDSVRYTHSLNGGDNWSSPLVVDEAGPGENQNRAASGPRMVVQGQNVHIIWAAGDQLYRHHRFSSDGGLTWSAPEQIFGDLQGQAWDGLTVDDAGRVHFFGQIRYPMAIYHAYWDHGRWSIPYMVYLVSLDGSAEGMRNRVHAHFTVPMVRLGNQLVLTFTDPPADPNRRLFVMYRTLDDIPSLETLPTPTPAATKAPAASPTPMPTKPAPTETATPAVISTTGVDPAEDAANPNRALQLGLVPVVLLLLGTVFLRLRFKRKP